MSLNSEQLRTAIRLATLADESVIVPRLIEEAGLASSRREAIVDTAVGLVEQVRGSDDPGLMEQFLGEYGLTSTEGVALMCLAEALLRVPDPGTMDALIQDKIAPGDWGQHLGHSSSSLVNASTWALLLTGHVLSDEESPGLASTLHGMIRRVGEPVVRTAVARAMQEMGRQFVLGESIESAMMRSARMEARGYTYSYDMLGEAARTEADARRYHLAYADAIGEISRSAGRKDIRDNPGISVKLSALHCRYEYSQRERCVPEIAARLSSLLTIARSGNIGLNIDAEEADRLDLSLDIIERAISDPALADWDGFGVVVQAYSRRATQVLDWLHDLAARMNRRIMVRLVKGAYWDAEIKRAQVLGLPDYPVFTRKTNTDIAYLACVRKLLAMTDVIYPQFATHNAHTIAAVMALADDTGVQGSQWEFQRLHGMGESLYNIVRAENDVRCRIYAPVGTHRDLLAYLVRRLLENGANSSFVHQVVDLSVPAGDIVADPVSRIEALAGAIPHPHVPPPANLYSPGRINSKGWDLTDPLTIQALERERALFRDRQWRAGPMIGSETNTDQRSSRQVLNPADPSDVVGEVVDASSEDIVVAFEQAGLALPQWSAMAVSGRADILRTAAELFQAGAPELMALAAREAGKNLPDCVAEIREAVDFLRYYAAMADSMTGTQARGLVVAISPWNFPLAIFTGQVAAALVTGNVVLAKPAEQTCLMAARAVEMLLDAGVPRGVLQLLPGGGEIGAALVSNPEVAGVCFTGSNETAQLINQAMAEHGAPDTPLIAETGGINAMIVDSTALAEQAVRDILVSAFQSAGQRCSAARILYVQRDVADRVLAMLGGAMDALQSGDPWSEATDVGPVIDAEAYGMLVDYIAAQRRAGHVILGGQVEEGEGYFVPPTVIQVDGIGDIEREVFGPVLHVAMFDAGNLESVIDAINARQFGLTLGIHSRVDRRVEQIVSRARVGNMYVNRNQVGAIVGSQPFGGVGLSGTGPKAGGPLYLQRFTRSQTDVMPGEQELPGPTGESNRYRIVPRGRILCMGNVSDASDTTAYETQCEAAGQRGNEVLDGRTRRPGDEALDGVMATGTDTDLKLLRQELAHRSGPVVPLIFVDDTCMLVSERSLCIDTTAAGGNASLLAAVSDEIA